jgi:hypothetical protein
MIRRQLLISLGALSLFASQVSAQRYTLKKQPEQLDEFSVGAVFMSSCTMKLSNLGNVPGIYNDSGKYNDFTIDEDTASKNDGKTYNFQFNDITQLCDKNGKMNPFAGYVRATAVKAEAVDGVFNKEGDSGMTLGMEATYTHYFDKKHTFGLVVGLANNGFSMKKSAEWDANVSTRSDVYKAEYLNAMDGFEGNSERPRVFSTDEPEAYVYLDKVNSYTEDNVGITTVDGSWAVKAAYITLRTGVAYNFRLTRHFMLRLSGGLALVSASSRFSWDESYSILDSDGNPLSDTLRSLNSDDYSTIESSGESDKHKVLIGGWGDLGAHYRISRRLTVYSALGYQSTTSLRQETSAGHIIDLDSSKLYSLKTGFTWAF